MTENLDILIREATNADGERVKSLVFGILREYGFTPDEGGTDADLSDLEANYTRRGGAFEVLEDARGNLVGTVGLYPMNGETVELRKMYLARELRGRGLGKRTLARAIERARELGFKKVYLETAGVLKEAVGLYCKFGFQPTCERHTPRCDQAYTLDI